MQSLLQPWAVLKPHVPARESGGRKPDLNLCSHLKGYRQKDYFIATQGPLAHTVQDFWRMVWECKCHAIVMLTEVQEREQVSPPRPSRLWVRSHPPGAAHPTGSLSPGNASPAIGCEARPRLLRRERGCK